MSTSLMSAVHCSISASLFTTGKHLLGQFQHFLEAVRYRVRNMNLPNSLSDRGYPIFSGQSATTMDQLPIRTPESLDAWWQDQVFWMFRLSAAWTTNRHGSFSIFCGNREFSALEFGDSLFHRSRRHITPEREAVAPVIRFTLPILTLIQRCLAATWR